MGTLIAYGIYSYYGFTGLVILSICAAIILTIEEMTKGK